MSDQALQLAQDNATALLSVKNDIDGLSKTITEQLKSITEGITKDREERKSNELAADRTQKIQSRSEHAHMVRHVPTTGLTRIRRIGIDRFGRIVRRFRSRSSGIGDASLQGPTNRSKQRFWTVDFIDSAVVRNQFPGKFADWIRINGISLGNRLGIEINWTVRIKRRLIRGGCS